MMTNPGLNPAPVALSMKLRTDGALCRSTPLGKLSLAPTGSTIRLVYLGRQSLDLPEVVRE
jgi:hypothetical protein